MILAEETFKLPQINYVALAPMLILFGGATVAVLVEAFVGRGRRYPVQLAVSLLSLVAALVMVVKVAHVRQLTAGGAVAVDGPALFLEGTLIVLGIVALLLVAERSLEPGGPFVAVAAVTAGTEADRAQAQRRDAGTEVYPLLLFALGGMMLFVSANDLLTMFVALEVFSLPLYLMCGLARRRRLLSQEAALKYFLLGAFASAFFLFGIAMLYGYAGQIGFRAIQDAIQASTNARILDVYQGAPTPVTAFMAGCTKVAAFGALLRVIYVAFERTAWDLRLVIGGMAVLTMVVGSILAVTQTDIKRLLAYSSIANAGYLLVGVLAVGGNGNRDGLASSMFYLVAYGFSVVAAFGVVTLVRDADGEATHLSRWAGLGRRSPLYAGLFTFLLLAFAGIPLTSGFTSKFAVFGAALASGQAWLVVLGAITSVILAFPYLRVVVLVWLSEPGENTPTVSIPGALTSAALAIGTLATLLLGVAPQPLLELSSRAAEFVR